VYPFLILLAGMLVVIGGILFLRLHAFLALLLGAFVVATLTPADALRDFALEKGASVEEADLAAEESSGERISKGFGRTTGQVGIVIAMASIIGICLLESGAADRMVRSALRIVGPTRAPVAFTASGFLLAIPVFFDTVFYLMIPLAKATRLRTGKAYLFYVLAIVAGGTMAHSLVPPTPGPLFVAGEFGVDIGLMILVGMAVGFLAASAGFLYGYWVSKRIELPLRESEESLDELETIAGKTDAQLPPLWLAATPILLPVVLIAGRTLIGSLDSANLGILTALGGKNIALSLSAAIALLILLWKTSKGQTVSAVKKALKTAGVIILIIGAGGAFGSVLQQTGIGSAIQSVATTYHVGILPLAFLLTALIRTAQGSATVAMVTAAGAMIGLADPAQLGFHPVYLAIAIGCGSKPIWWMNDSGFWVVSQMSGMTEKEGLMTLTPLAAIMGVTGLVGTMLAAHFFPLT
jgi:GntP family gluconate:H+ symporter